MLKNNEKIIIKSMKNKNNDTLPFESGTFDIRFRILNTFSLNEREISSKTVSYSELFV